MPCRAFDQGAADVVAGGARGCPFPFQPAEFAFVEREFDQRGEHFLLQSTPEVDHGKPRLPLNATFLPLHVGMRCVGVGGCEKPPATDLLPLRDGLRLNEHDEQLVAGRGRLWLLGKIADLGRFVYREAQPWVLERAADTPRRDGVRRERTMDDNTALGESG